MDQKNIATDEEMRENSKNKPGGIVALMYFFSWGLYGLFIGISLVFTLDFEWAKAVGANFDDVPAGIMAAGSIGGLIALAVCAFAGPIICNIRAKKWERKAVILSGILGPLIGIMGGICGLLVKNPALLFILLVAGMPLGVNLGRKLAEM
jgi:hypothetical protein